MTCTEKIYMTGKYLQGKTFAYNQHCSWTKHIYIFTSISLFRNCLIIMTFCRKFCANTWTWTAAVCEVYQDDPILCH